MKEVFIKILKTIVKYIVKGLGIEIIFERNPCMKVLGNIICFIPLAVKGFKYMRNDNDIDSVNPLNLYFTILVSFVVSCIFFYSVGTISLISIWFIPSSYLVGVAETKIKQADREMNLQARYDSNNERKIINDLFDKGVESG